jgi:hypothetical protein
MNKIRKVLDVEILEQMLLMEELRKKKKLKLMDELRQPAREEKK